MFKKVMFKKVSSIGLISVALALGACSNNDDDSSSDSSGNEDGEEVVETTPAATPPAATPGVGNSVYDNIVNNSDLSTLLAAINAAGLADTLDDESAEFTVFAPSNTAFLALEALNPTEQTIAGLLLDPAALTNVLTFHVISGTVDAMAATAAVPVSLTTVFGAPVAIATSDTAASGLSVEGADIEIADSDYDAATSIGVVHVISAVLLPPETL